MNSSLARIVKTLRSSATTAALSWPAWMQIKPTEIETELWWAETEQALSAIAADMAALADRR